jgi:hypothetical protein
MAGETLWQYKGTVKPLAGYSGLPCEQGALLVIVKSKQRVIAESLIVEKMTEMFLTPTAFPTIEEILSVPSGLTLRVQSTYREAIERGLGVHFQAFR